MTVEELGLRMTQREFMGWVAYQEEYGELSPTRMFDRGPALVAYMLQALQGGKNKLVDYLPYYKEPSNEMTGDPLEAGLLAQFGANPKV